MTVKQVIVIRTDLKMRRGKEISQGSHGSGQFLWDALEKPHSFWVRVCDVFFPRDVLTPVVREWRATGMTKVCLQVATEEALFEVYRRAVDAGVVCHLITDSGRTEFGGVRTHTCVAVGPDRAERIDPITGSLKLY